MLEPPLGDVCSAFFDTPELRLSGVPESTLHSLISRADVNWRDMRWRMWSMMRTGIQMSKALSGIADFGLCCEFGAPQRVMNDNIMCCAPVVVEEGRRQ